MKQEVQKKIGKSLLLAFIGLGFAALVISVLSILIAVFIKFGVPCIAWCIEHSSQNFSVNPLKICFGFFVAVFISFLYLVIFSFSHHILEDETNTDIKGFLKLFVFIFAIPISLSWGIGSVFYWIGLQVKIKTLQIASIIAASVFVISLLLFMYFLVTGRIASILSPS